jgi:hypothetical protein
MRLREWYEKRVHGRGATDGSLSRSSCPLTRSPPSPWSSRQHERAEERCRACRPDVQRRHTLQRNTSRYFWEETNPENGLIPDNTAADDNPASIAGVGFALASYPVAAERLFVSRAQAVERALATLRFFWKAPQGPMADATGQRGFFYHFLDVTTGRRAWRCELSTIDTTILVAGALTGCCVLRSGNGR